jgi:hypothetical protein
LAVVKEPTFGWTKPEDRLDPLVSTRRSAVQKNETASIEKLFRFN